MQNKEKSSKIKFSKFKEKSKGRLRNISAKNNKSPKKRRRQHEAQSEDDAERIMQQNAKDDVEKKRKSLKKKKTSDDKINECVNSNVEEHNNEVENGVGDKKSSKSKKKRKFKKAKKVNMDEVDDENDVIEEESIKQHGKLRKGHNLKKKNNAFSENKAKTLAKRDNDPKAVYEISSVDEDSSRGMKKWIMEYHQGRPGLKVLQDRIDDFITAYEEKQEEEKKEREIQAAEGGWTVVTHHKGRKKTTDSESGIAVGSVAQAAVLDNMSKKKSTEVALDFYRFQKREANRNEVLALQRSFEQNKKRVEQLRAARKFRPY